MPALFLFLLMALDGEQVYKQHCAQCHDTASPGRVPTREAMSHLTPRRIVNSLESGIMFMPGRRMTPAERRTVAQHLTGKAFTIEPSVQARSPCVSSPFPPAQLTASGLPGLKLKWAFGFEGDVMAFAQPTVYGNRLYVGSAGGTVHSLDAKTGCTHWRFEADAAVRAGIVVEGGKAYFGDLHSNVYAVDTTTGKQLWKRRLDSHPSARITGTPAFHNGRLYVPVSSFEEGMASMPSYECCTFRGSLVALDAATGKPIWQRFMIDRPARPTGRNKRGAQQHGPAGVAIWSTPTIDAARGLVYVTTGDNYTDPGTPLSDAVLAIRLRDGTIAWSQQVTANDRWNAACLGDKVNCPVDNGPDADFGAPAILAGNLLIAAQKSGMVYALDPGAKGEIVWKTEAGKGGPLGGIQWGHAVGDNKVFAPISGVELADMVHTGGGLTALNLKDGKVAWKAPPAVCAENRTPCSPAQMAGALSIPGAVISGARDGIYRAYSADNGRILWQFDTWCDFETVNKVTARGGSIDGPHPVTANGMLFMNSGYSLWNGRGGNVLLAFGPP